MEGEPIQQNYQGNMPNSSGSSISYAPPHPELQKWLLDPEGILIEIEGNLRNAEWDSKNERWRQIGEPLMNDKGINAFKGVVLRVFLTKITTISTFSDEEIRKNMVDVCDVVIELLVAKQAEYEIDKANLSIIRMMVEQAIHASLKKARDGIWLDTISSTSKTTEIHQSNPQQQKKGFWGMFKI